MNVTTASRPPAPGRHRFGGLRRRLTAMAAVAALAVAGPLALAGPAHADANAQITDSADPVTVNTSYTYTVTVPASAGDDTTDLTIDLSGAAATFTAVTNSVGGDLECTPSGTHIQCNALVPVAPGYTVTATVLPTATGTVTADVLVNFINIIGADSTTTTITDSTPPGCTITGTAGDDNLSGTNGDDIICGLAGNDTINAGNGNDTVYPGPGNDVASGDNGNDTLIDQSGTDTLNGNNGDDSIDVQDTVSGDTANGGNGVDTCAADAGDTTTSC
ncbi:calcium-binding protein [Streptomyces formicae]|uniref:Alkaline phosphatase n=1 Tax=Streptomyces formicae TaxID=1616117 RepID=A0A291Q0I3_9ACTN|nr:hypothetical protein [Streptomyces formicae]ATL25072.1 Alkaline phosphatase [Streptomyces formicae]